MQRPETQVVLADVHKKIEQEIAAQGEEARDKQTEDLTAETDLTQGASTEPSLDTAANKKENTEPLKIDLNRHEIFS